MGINNSLSYMMMRIMTLFVLLAGAYFMLQNQLSVGDFMAFILLTNIFFRPIEKINAIIESYPKGYAGFKRYIAIMDTEPEIDDHPEAHDRFGLKGNIEYNNVSFGYTKEQPVLENINLTILKEKQLPLLVHLVQVKQRCAASSLDFMKLILVQFRLTVMT